MVHRELTASQRNCVFPTALSWTSPRSSPLLELLARARPAGVALVRGRASDLLDWRLAELRRITRVSEEPFAPPRQRPPLVASGSRARQITPMREQRALRERERAHGCWPRWPRTWSA